MIIKQKPCRSNNFQIVFPSTILETAICIAPFFPGNPPLDHLIPHQQFLIIIMLSTIFESEVYLGFLKQQPLEQKSYEQTFLGGRPIFLYKPNAELLECTICNKEKLTFVCQIFCPLEAEQAYNRVLYVFYCEKCERVFRAIKQQTGKDSKPEKIEVQVRVISEHSFEVESSGIEIKELQKIIKKAQYEVQEEVIEQKQEEDFQDEEDEIEMKELEKETIEKMGFQAYQEDEQAEFSKEQLQSLKHASQSKEEEKEEKDLAFEQYKKIMSELDGPVLMYSNIPIPYNNQLINPKHFCKYCNSKLSLELQLTEKILTANQKLLRLDWGSLMVFTCSNSCQQSSEECLVVQYEVDAINDSTVSALRKRQKNKKRKQQKDKSKSKEKELTSKPKEQAKKPSPEPSPEEGDWD